MAERGDAAVLVGAPPVGRIRLSGCRAAIDQLPTVCRQQFTTGGLTGTAASLPLTAPAITAATAATGIAATALWWRQADH